MVLVVGDCVILEPVPTRVPPQEPVYHFHDAPVPKEPPLTVNVVGCPQVVLGLALAEVGSVEGVFTVTVTCAQVVVPQPPPSALTK